MRAVYAGEKFLSLKKTSQAGRKTMTRDTLDIIILLQNSFPYMCSEICN